MGLLLRAGTRQQFNNTAVPFKGTNTVLITDERALVQLLEDGTTVTASMERTEKTPSEGMMEAEIRFDGTSYWILLHKELYRAVLPEPVWGHGAKNTRADAEPHAGPRP